jgi:hypothetical protein
MRPSGINARAVKVLTVLLSFWLPAAVLVAPAAVLVAQEKPPKPKPPPKPAAAPAKAPAQKPAQQQQNQAKVQEVNKQARAVQQALNAQNLPAGLTLQRLSQMSPEERAKALSNLPPARQVNIEKRVENYANEPPEQQAREQQQESRMAALPPERRAQVRQSLMDLNSIQPPRRGVVLLELNKLGGMTDDQRLNYMNRPGFRRNFSAQEIQLMDNLHGIVP